MVPPYICSTFHTIRTPRPQTPRPQTPDLMGAKRAARSLRDGFRVQEDDGRVFRRDLDLVEGAPVRLLSACACSRPIVRIMPKRRLRPHLQMASLQASRSRSISFGSKLLGRCLCAGGACPFITFKGSRSNILIDSNPKLCRILVR